MKKNFIKLLIAITVISFGASCDKVDGAHYSGESNKVSFLTGTTLNLTMDSSIPFIEVPIARTSVDGNLSVDVTLTSEESGYTSVFKVDEPAEFLNNESKSYVKVSYSNLETIDPSSLSASSSGYDVIVGLAFPFNLKVTDSKQLSSSNKGEVKVNALNLLEFEDIGIATLNSIEGWSEEIIEVPVQKATTANVYKIVEPFGFNSFAFMIASDGKTVVCPDQTIYDFGPSGYGPVKMINVVGTVNEQGQIVLEVDSYQVDAGSFGGGVEIITLPN